MTLPIPKTLEARDSNGPAPQLRSRKSGTIPATIAENGIHEVKPDGDSPRPYSSSSTRRRSSFMTDGSSSMDDRRPLRRSQTESLLLSPRATGHEHHVQEEPSLWYSAPLLFAIVPAVGGVAFNKGSILLTDIALLVLTAVYLNWCLVSPWFWYHSAQRVKVGKPPMEGPISEEALQEDLDEDQEHDEDAAPNAGEYPVNGNKAVPPMDPAKSNPAAGVPDQGADSREASAELEMHELAALALCVLGPLIGSYILHFIRSSLLSIHGGQLVSNLHLTLFVLGAELRPLGHCIKLVQARTLHLQRIVRTDPHASDDTAGPDPELLTQLSQRLTEVEDSVASSGTQQNHAESVAKAEPTASPDDVRRTQQALQTQIDALNRAVRRYEKRENARMVHNEERLQDIDLRLREALSLSAAAAHHSQRPGLIVGILHWVMTWIRWTFDLLTWPVRWASDLGWSVLKKAGLARPLRRKRPVKRTESPREVKERERLHKKREDGVARPSDAWLKSRR